MRTLKYLIIFVMSLGSSYIIAPLLTTDSKTYMLSILIYMLVRDAMKGDIEK